MEKINVNIAALEGKIEKLMALQTECRGIEVTANTLQGSGMSIQVIHAIDDEYAQLKETMLTLLSNSIAFFQNVKSSLVEADDNAANQLN